MPVLAMAFPDSFTAVGHGPGNADIRAEDFSQFLFGQKTVRRVRYLAIAIIYVRLFMLFHHYAPLSRMAA